MFSTKLFASQSVLSRCVCPVFPRAGCLRVHTAGPGQAAQIHTHTPQLNSNRTSAVRCGLKRYERMYPVMLVQPDGSTLNLRFKEPRCILVMPVNLDTLSEEERKARQKKREVKKIKPATVDFEDDFRPDQYSRFWKKK